MNSEVEELATNASPKGITPAPGVSDGEANIKALLDLPSVEPWPEPVDGKRLLDELAQTLRSYVFLPKWAAETLALWVVHSYAFKLRDVTTYIGLESPEHRCGKSTLVTVLSELAHLAVVASNVSSPAFFRVIEQLQPSLLIDEADTFLQGNDELRGILNAGYQRKTAYVLRAVSQPAQVSNSNPGREEGGGQKAHGGDGNAGLARYSCWCPKVIARIGRLPATLADRCIVLRMQRKTAKERCERLRNLKGGDLRRQSARFVADHAAAIAAAEPQIPGELNDRAADIWEPLLALADLAGGEWPGVAREAAVSVSAAAQENNPAGSLLLDIFYLFLEGKVDRMFSHELSRMFR